VIDRLLREEFDDAFTAAAEALLGTASAFGAMGESPAAKHHMNRWYVAAGELDHAARRLWNVVAEFETFGFEPPVPDAADKPLLDAALASGKAYARALALSEAREWVGVVGSPEFEAADMAASRALMALLDAAWEAFGVVEAEPC
jgi:hypothetical protein